MTPPKSAPAANNLDAFFMPFTANRQFKKNPRLLAKAKGVHYWTPEGRKIIDGTAGLWCVNAGHGREEIKAAIAKQLDEMDYAPSFQMGHPKAFELAARHAAHAAGRPQPRLLLQLGLRGRRFGAQDRARLSPRQRPGHAHPLRRPRARLPRRRLRRHLGRRHGQQPQVVRRDAAGRRPPAAHPPAAERLLQGPARARRASSPMRWKASSACTTPRTSPP